MIKFSTTVTCQYDTAFSPFKASEYSQSLEWVKTSGFDSAEICISNYTDIDLQAMRKELDQLGIGCSTISTGQSRTLEDISLIHEHPAQRKKAQARINEHIDAAVILGSKVTIGLLRGLGSMAKAAEEMKLLTESLAPCLEYAEKNNIVLLMEAINRYETAHLNSAEDTVKFLETMGGSSSLGILWDVFHANIEDPGFEEAVKVMGTKLRHVHMADSNRWFPGYGHLDFEGLYNILSASGYDDYMSFECLNLPSTEVVLEKSGEFISKLKSR